MNAYLQPLIDTNIELIKLKLTIIRKDIDGEQHLSHNNIFHNKNMQRLVSTEWISQLLFFFFK